MKSFTFAGERKRWLTMSANKRKVPFPSITRNTKQIPGVHGSYLSTTNLEPIVIEQPVRFVVESDMEALLIIDELASWLYTEGPMPLQFDDEPGRTYFAVVQNTMEDFEKMVRVVRKGTIQFLCLDPLAYSDEIWKKITPESPYVVNEGTMETFPMFRVSVRRKITEVTITNRSLEGNPSIVLGRPVSVDQEPFEREELVFHDTMQSTASWQQASVVDVGYIRGNMTTDRDGFYAEDYGENVGNWNWQGPSLQKGIGTTLTDFRADIFIEARALRLGTGMLDVYFRDANGNQIVKMGFGDYWQDRAENYGRALLGHFETGKQLEAFANHRNTWKQFDGIMRVERVDNEYYFYFGQIDEDGVHHARRIMRYVDKERKYTAPISTVQVGFRKFTQYKDLMRLRVKEIKLYRLNTTDDPVQDIPYIAGDEDVFTVYTKDSHVLRNGEPADDYANLRTEFFPLKAGYNHIEVEPSDAVGLDVKYRKAYL